MVSVQQTDTTRAHLIYIEYEETLNMKTTSNSKLTPNLKTNSNLKMTKGLKPTSNMKMTSNKMTRNTK